MTARYPGNRPRLGDVVVRFGTMESVVSVINPDGTLWLSPGGTAVAGDGGTR